MVIAQTRTQTQIWDTALLVDALRGEEFAMEQLFDRHSTAVYSVAKRILQDAPSAEDVMHRVFMQIWREPTTFLQTDGDLRTLLVILTRNRSIVVLRNRISKRPQVAASLLDTYKIDERGRGPAKTFLSDPHSAEDFDFVETAFFKGTTISEIATGTRHTPQAVKKNLCSALQQLHLSLTPQVATRQPV